jgi:galactokinase
MNQFNELKVSTPGRICLFGEHQDYLGLPVIASAISLRIYIYGERRNDNLVKILMPDINEEDEIVLDFPIKYIKERDYFRSVLNILWRKGYTFPTGFNIKVHGEIPINAGTSSSSALIVTWVNFLSQMSKQNKKLSPEEVAQLAYEAEVLEFSEPGGMMDQYTTAIGGTIYIDFHPELKIEKLNPELGSFVLGNSMQPKDTKFILSNVKNRILKVIKELKKFDSSFSLHNIHLNDLKQYEKHLSKQDFEILMGTLINRDITQEARKILKSKTIDHKLFGKLLLEHHKILRDVLKISTPKIDLMIEEATKVGAYGGKINGSGGGGCMFVYAPENSLEVKKAIEKVGGEAFIITLDEGIKEEILEIA